MHVGNYHDYKNFDALRVEKFPITLWDRIKYSQAGCGANVLSNILGESPLKFKKSNNHYPDSYMVKQLRKHGVSCHKITQSNLTNTKEAYLKLDDRNVLMFCLLLKRGEGSWGLLYNQTFYHNQESSQLHVWNLINSPIKSLFCLHKKEWA